MIKCLSEEVQGKLRSGVAVSSLQQCVEELILNSIDAGASCVGVRMDMEAFKVQVIDNGSGMSVGDMERVGNRYYTSKCSSVEDLENLRSYGFRGEAVASIVSLATLVEISSRAKSSVKTHVKVFKEGTGLDVFEAETTRPCAGTTFVICNFFHNMPVRRKRMDAVLEGERIRHRVEAISLMHPSVSFTLKNDCTGIMMVKLPKARDTYHRFVQIHGVGRAQKLREISHARGQFAVIGHIGREGHYNNSLQFLYVNERLLLKTRIHKLLNLLLRKLKNDSPDLQSAAASRSPKHKRGGQELYGTYIVNIKCSYSEYDVCLEPAKTLIEFKDWDGVLLCVEEAVNFFLSRENLVVELSREDDLEDTSQKLFGKAGADQEGVRASVGISTLECSIGRTLASEAVHRKREEGDGVLKSGVGVGQTSDQTECNEEGEEERHTNDQNHKCTKSEECRGAAPRCDLVTLTPTDGLEPLDEEEPTFSGAEEDSQGVGGCTPRSVSRQESEQLKRPCSIISIAEELQPGSLSSIKRTAPNKGTSGHGQTLAGNGRISLSDEPYVHESLQTRDLPLINKRVLENASKRKIALIQRSGRVRPGQKANTDCVAVIPAKMPKFTSCKKLSLRQEAGSLDQFRRIYGKSDELTSPSLDRTRCLLTDAREPQTDSFDSTPQDVPVRQDPPPDEQEHPEERERGITETRNMQRDFQSPPTVSTFTKIKPPVSVQSRTRGISLAAKLSRHLKQHRSEVTQTVLTPRPSLDDTCLRSADDNTREDDDDNNDEHPNDTALNPEPVPSCDTTSPQLAEREEATTAVASDCWLRHYDTSAGKTVYVNKVTGISQYEDPPPEETQVRCTSDVTNMAVSVISKMGR